MTDQLKKKYEEIAAYVYSFCQKLGCSAQTRKVTGLCCDYSICDMVQAQAGQKFNIELSLDKLNTFVKNGCCIIPPHLRPLCAVHACDRLQLFAGKDFMSKYMKLRDEICAMEYKEQSMTKKDTGTRKSISMRGSSYDKLKKYCEEKGITMSGWLEDQAEKFLLNIPSKKSGGKEFKEKVFEFLVPKEPPKKSTKDDPSRGGGNHLL